MRETGPISIPARPPTGSYTLPPMPMPSTKRRLSLRVALASGLGGLLCGLLVLAVVVQYWTYDATERRRQLRTHFIELHEMMATRLTALLDQEVGLRAYLATGDARFLEPYDAGKRSEAMADFELGHTLDLDDRHAFGKELGAFERAAAAWQSDIADPQVAARRDGALADLPDALRRGKASFDTVRVTHAALMRALRNRTESAIAVRDRELEDIGRYSLLFTFAGFLLGGLLIRYLLQHTVAPLAALAERAGSRQPLDPPSEDEPIGELYGLSRALFDLDSAARERERLAEQARAQAVALGGFGEFVQQLADDAELHSALARTMQERVAPSKLHILVRNASRNRLEIAWPEGKNSEDQYKFPILVEPIKCRAVRTLQPVTSSVGNPTCCKCALGVPAQGSYHCVPMLAAGELVGLVNMQTEDRPSFDPELQTLSQSYISFASTTLSSIRLLAATRERALRDPLTQAYNRSFLSEYLMKQLSQAARRSSQLSVLMLDLDHFKRLNDTYGHQIGDRALTTFASCLNEQVRASDAVIRYGGEEFVVLLSDADANTAMAIAERIRASVEKQVVSADGQPIGNILRCSIGVATYPTHGNDEATLLSAADRALYRAKANGRNNVVLVSSDMMRTSTLI
ncbi:MAG TPA: diguanylate cyclase [Polyangiales bacterium]|nr:diguanylate cyclase [Polyangiales bacterium]